MLSDFSKGEKISTSNPTLFISCSADHD